tara:strand:- start:1167 stop:2090 length:924 start_codon:yes stop_codon:yes gene_type:complete
MRIGVFISETWGPASNLDQVRDRARQAEKMGFASGWVPYIPRSLDALISLQAASSITTNIELGSAVIPTYLFHPLALARQAYSLRGEIGSRFTLGIGCSQKVVIEKSHGLPFIRPAQHVREYLEILKRSAEQSGHMAYHGEMFEFEGPFLTPGGGDMQILVGAIGPLMLKVAGELADGTIATMSDEGAIEREIVPLITAAAEAAGRRVPRIAAVIPVHVTDDIDTAKGMALDSFSVYEKLPRYKRMIELGDQEHASGLCVIGNEQQVRQRLRRFADVGLTDLIAAPFTFGEKAEQQHLRILECLATF